MDLLKGRIKKTIRILGHQIWSAIESALGHYLSSVKVSTQIQHNYLSEFGSSTYQPVWVLENSSKIERLRNGPVTEEA